MDINYSHHHSLKELLQAFHSKNISVRISEDVVKSGKLIHVGSDYIVIESSAGRYCQVSTYKCHIPIINILYFE